MSYVSILVPSFKTKHTSKLDILATCERHLGLNSENIELFRLVPFAEEAGPEQPTEIAVRMKENAFSIKTLEEILGQNERLNSQLEKLKEALAVCSKELEKIKSSNVESERVSIKCKVPQISIPKEVSAEVNKVVISNEDEEIKAKDIKDNIVEAMETEPSPESASKHELSTKLEVIEDKL